MNFARFHRAPSRFHPQRLLAADEAAPVGDEHEGGEPVGGEDEAPVVGHQPAASASPRSTPTRFETK